MGSNLDLMSLSLVPQFLQVSAEPHQPTSQPNSSNKLSSHLFDSLAGNLLASALLDSSRGTTQSGTEVLVGEHTIDGGHQLRGLKVVRIERQAELLLRHPLAVVELIVEQWHHDHRLAVEDALRQTVVTCGRGGEIIELECCC